jgi:hypothetical protein
MHRTKEREVRDRIDSSRGHGLTHKIEAPARRLLRHSIYLQQCGRSCVRRKLNLISKTPVSVLKLSSILIWIEIEAYDFRPTPATRASILAE